MSDAIQSPDPIVSIEDRTELAKALARTYGGDHDPWERVQEYQRVLEYTGEHPNKGSSAVANALDLPRGRIRPWMDNNARPDPTRGIQAAESHGWLDLSWENDIFAGLNVLVAWVFSGGSIDVEHYVPRFAVTSDADRNRLTVALEHVGLQPKVIREETEKRAAEIRPAEYGAILGRLLSVLGSPVGTKNTDSQFSLPPYLDKAPHQIRLDFARTYVLNRQTPRGDRPNRPIQLLEQRSATYRRDLVKFLSEVVGDPEMIRGGNERAPLYLTRRSASMLCEEPTFGEWG